MTVHEITNQLDDMIVDPSSNYKSPMRKVFPAVRPLSEGEYEALIPVTDHGLLLSIRQENGFAIFTGYRRLPDGSKGPAELKNLIKNVNDRIISVDGVSTVGKSFDDVVELLKQAKKQAHLRFLSVNHPENNMHTTGNPILDFQSPPAKMNKVVSASGIDTTAVPTARYPHVTFDPSIVESSAFFAPLTVSSSTFGAETTGKTPFKVKKAIENNTAALEVKERWENCTGIPVRVCEFYKDGSRKERKCSMCQNDTTWYCFGCKAWFCLSQGKHTKDRKVTYVKQEVKYNDMVFELSCFHQKHKDVWEKLNNKDDN